MLVIRRKISEEVTIDVAGVTVKVVLLGASGSKVKLGFSAPREVVILRGELGEVQGRMECERRS
jgi:carbon storage regulator CsrA